MRLTHWNHVLSIAAPKAFEEVRQEMAVKYFVSEVVEGVV